MVYKWLGLALVCATGITLLSCADPKELQSITIQPGTETFGASNIPVSSLAGATVQLRALGSYIHPPVTKDITDQVTWASNTPSMVTVNSTGLITVTGGPCGGTLISATEQTNKDGSGVSSSGAVVTGYMNANVTCYTGTGPTVTVQSSGAGAGTISSSPAGLGCALSNGSSCTGSFPSGTTVNLTAAATTGTFGSWAGCDSTSGTLCIINNLTNYVTVTVTFN